MEIIRVASENYDRYEELLLQRDQLEKEAEGYRLEYTREFGDLITESFKAKIECIGIKKSITYCQTRKNKGLSINSAEMKDYLDTHMAAYYTELNSLIAQHNFAKSGKPISPNQVSEIKKIYRRLAKMLHPDISPLTSKYPELLTMFRDVISAYRNNDLKRLQELDVMIAKTLDEIGEEHVDIVIPNVEERISELEEEIARIIRTEPYTYKEILADAFKVEEKKKALEKELEDYKTYLGELQKILSGLLA